jgi:beta-xylosidase
MQNWTCHGYVLMSDDFPYGRSNTAWAAQVVKGLDNKYYFYVPIEGNGSGVPYGEQIIAVAVAESPTGPFVPHNIPVIRNAETTTSDIDPTAWIDDDGTTWLFWGQNPPYYVKMNSDRSSPGYMREREAGAKLAQITNLDNYVEGPWVYKRGKYYYLVYASDLGNDASGFSFEKIRYAMADKITGPWRNMGFVSLGAKNNNVDGEEHYINNGGYSYTIHPSIITFKNQDYFIYHNGMLTIDNSDGHIAPDASDVYPDIPSGQIWGACDGRRAVAIEYMYYNRDGSIKMVALTEEGISVPPIDF